MRLIDAESIMRKIVNLLIESDNLYLAGKVAALIDCEPTAFDKEKVIEELKDMANAAWKNTGNKFCNSDMAIARHRALIDALEIVYKGGTE
jgi:hypothetical protein